MEPWSGTPQVPGLSLDAFVPELLRRHIAEQPANALHPLSRSFPAAVLVTDVSGFSSLAETFAGRGTRGAEDLNDVLNFFCGHIAHTIESHGGDLIRFAGDAVLGLWPLNEDATGALRAAQCSLRIQEVLAESEPPNGLRLPLRAGLGVGEVLCATVGGVEGRWELLVAGPALADAVGAVSVAAPGETLLSASVWPQIAGHALGSRVKSLTRLERLIDPIPVLQRTKPSCIEPALLRAYVPRSVQVRIDAGQTDWLAEFRRVTALFIKLDSLNYVDVHALAQLQRAMAGVQSVVHRYGGSINQLVVDDKGTVVVCAWGLALHSYSDDQTRSIRAALDLRSELRAVGVSASFGLATGDVFAGLLGTSRRCEYAMVGDIVNLAARLMEAAAGDILCDVASFDASRAQIAFETQAFITPKGREVPVEVFRPLEFSADSSEMVGRHAERQLLRNRLESLARHNTGGVVILEGEPGIGKSRLVTDVIERAVARGIRTLLAAGDPIERSTAHHVWGALLAKLLGLDATADRGAAERRVMDLLQSDEKLLPFASLLNPILRLALPETDSSRNATPRGRSELTRELLVHLFRSAGCDHTTLLIIEDAHWLDSASWAVAESLARDLPGMLLLIAMRVSARDDQPGALARLIDEKGALLLHLDVLSTDDERALVCQRIQARMLSEPVARLIRGRTDGHPFFIEELVYSLRDRGLIHVERGVCRLAGDPEGIVSMQLPTTVQVAVASRIDLLAVEHQLTVKVASIFGRTFSLAHLQSAYPIEIDSEQLRSHVEALIAHQLVQFSPPSSEEYQFTHAIIQEVAYGLLPYQLRRKLHASAALWYESRNSDTRASCYPVLAHHWSKAEQAAPAIFYLEKAGEQAIKRHANEEALRLFSEAVELDERLNPVPTAAAIVLDRRRSVSARDVSRAAWACRLGDAATNLSQWDQGRRHFKNALTLMGSPLPTSDRDFLIAIARAVGVQALRRLGLMRPRATTDRAASLLRDAVGAYQRIGSISYQDGRVIALIYALAEALNLADRLGPSPQLALVCSDVANVLGLAPLQTLARMYRGMAFQIASHLEDQFMAARIRARAAICRLGVGEWEACRDLEMAMTLSDEIGDSYLWEEYAAIRARAAQLQGDFTLAAQLGAEVRTRSAANRSIPHEIWGMAAEVWANLHLGQQQFVLEQSRRGLRLLSAAPNGDQIATIDFLGAEALAHLSRGEVELAHHTAERLLEAMRNTPRFGYFAVLGISAATETCLAVWELEKASSLGAHVARQAQHALATLERYARVSPPARARALLWRGCVQWLQGRQARAKRTWGRCFVESDRFSLPYEHARAHYEMGRRLDEPVSRRTHLASAEAGFRRLRAETDVQRVMAVSANNSTSRSVL
jgi:class 3 adenylate cyclase/tetratricopeptide (TPR) repeat protein